MNHHQIFTQEKYNKVPIASKAIVDDYISECRANGLTKATVSEYTSLLKYCEILIHDYLENKSLLELTRSDFRDLSLILQYDYKLSHSRINSILSALTNCLSYVEDCEDKWEDYNKNPMRKIKRLAKKPIKEKIFINRLEVKQIIDHLVANWMLQDAVLVSLAYDSGARISELAQVKKTDILKGNLTNVVILKGQKQGAPLMFMNDTKRLIEKWLELRNDDDIENLFVYPDFPTKSNSYLKREVTAKTLAARIVKAGETIHKHISPHVFRRSRAETLKQGEDERFNYRKFSTKEIQTLLRHKNISTTEIYLKDNSSEIMQNIVNLIN